MAHLSAIGSSAVPPLRGVVCLLLVCTLLLGACGANTAELPRVGPETTQATIPAAARTSPSSVERPAQWVTVKYRTDRVDVASFEMIPGSGSLVSGAWYDPLSGYLLVGLNGTVYHYCKVSNSVWAAFRVASSKGSFYNSNLKGSYDCRNGDVPDY